MDKKELLEKLARLLKVIGQEPTVLSQIPPCNVYSAHDYERFLNDEMTRQEEIELVNHCDNCVACQMELLQCKREIDLEEEKRYEEMYKKTSTFLQKLQDSASENIISVVLTVSKKLIEVLETTAEILPPPQTIAARGDIQQVDDRNKVEIIQDFTTPPVSLQASFEIEEKKKKAEEEALKVTLSIYNEESEEFLDGVEISVSGENYTKDVLTDSEGKAWFTIPYPGEYQITIRLPGSEEIEAKVKIKRP